SAAGLPFKPETPPGSAISADYMMLADRVRIEVDTGGYRLEGGQLVGTDGAVVRPQTSGSSPPGTGGRIGVGIGPGRQSEWGGRGRRCGNRDRDGSPGGYKQQSPGQYRDLLRAQSDRAATVAAQRQGRRNDPGDDRATTALRSQSLTPAPCRGPRLHVARLRH